MLEKIAEERVAELRVVKVNIDEEPALAQRYGVMSIPTILLFKSGEPAAAAIGAQPKSMLEKNLGLEAGAPARSRRRPPRRGQTAARRLAASATLDGGRQARDRGLSAAPRRVDGRPSRPLSRRRPLAGRR